MNSIKTTMLMALLMGLMVALGGAFAGHTGMTVMLVIALGMNFFSYWFSDRMVLSMYNAQEVDRQSAPELYGLVEKLAGRAGLPMPRVYIISDDDNNGGIIGLIATAIIAPIAAALIQMAISRSREYSADEGGAEICGNPNYLAAALEKIEYYAVHGAPLPEATPATAHMCIINPLTGRDISFKSLFSTHPDTQERIARLREQAQRMNIR